jgi:glutamate N-acetyltransferase/amino-acid N-acetyltransferase
MSIRHITLPKGFVAAGVKAGIKKSGRHDVAILAGDGDVSAAVLTTQNQVTGEPVRHVRSVLPRGYGRLRGIVVSSGNSNVCTGPKGFADAREMAKLTARGLGCDPDKVLVASTGIIGHRLPMPKVRGGIKAALAALGRDGDDDTLQAIMTTDTRAKSAVVCGRVGGEDITVAGIAKGSGMIAPSMATMIALITTDAKIAPALLHRSLKAAVAESFNAITVDSDTSTSDTVAAFASGAAGGKAIKSGSAALAAFNALLGEVCGELARAIIADGEGATKIVEVAVTGARNDRDARLAAMSVADSPLFKTAIHGGDPNWGRIAMALGKSAAKVDQDRLKIAIGGVTLFSGGTGRRFNVAKVEGHLAGREVRVECDLGLGDGTFTALTCDLSREYIAINADYTT